MTAPPLIVPFTKMTGAGNDFLVLDNRFLHFTDDELAGLAARFCPRRTAVGADGLLALEDPDAAGAAEDVHFRMRYRNADGSLATMCGNGARCLARFAARAGLGETGTDGARRLVFDTDGGRYTATVPAPDDASGPVTLAMPSPRAFAQSATAGDRAVWEIWTGTEHAVVFSDDADGEDLGALAPPLRHDPAFPRGANVNVVQALSDAGGDAVLRVRTFEKGVEGETLACGTGAVAAALAARLSGRIGADRVAVEMPGGTLAVGFTLADADGGDPAAAVGALTLSGPADAVFDGTLEWRGVGRSRLPVRLGRGRG